MELEQCDPDGCAAFTDKKNVGHVFREKQEQDHEEEDEKGAENAKRQTEARPEGERFAKRAEAPGEVAGGKKAEEDEENASKTNSIAPPQSQPP